jgi:hypothetical protein
MQVDSTGYSFLEKLFTIENAASTGEVLAYALRRFSRRGAASS